MIYDVLIFVAGFVDSIAGGGGLITLPVFTLLVGPGASAVATNKIVATVAAGTALVVYARKGHLNIKIGIPFLVGIGLGTFIGSYFALVVPVKIFKWLLLVICPILLYVTIKKNDFIKQHEVTYTPNLYILFTSGLIVGAYDGVFGPGGGTFMLFSLVLWAKLPLMVALATSKLANTISASVALGNFAYHGAVVWPTGLRLAGFIFAGALLGSTLATKKAETIVRPILVIVVSFLMIRIVFM